MTTNEAVDRLFWSFPLGNGRPGWPEDTPELRREYADALRDISPEHLDRVVTRMVRTFDTFPTVAEIKATYSELFLGEVKRDPDFERALGRLQRSGFPLGDYDRADWETVHAGVHGRVKDRLISGEIPFDVVRDDPNYVARECYRLITGIEVTKDEQP